MIDTADGSEFISPREAAQMLGVRLETVYGLVWVGRLEAKKREGRWLISRPAVEARRTSRRQNSTASGEQA